MPIQIIDRIRPSTGERLSGALNTGMQQLGTNLENKAIERNIGMDLSGISDPSVRQQLIADQLKYGRARKAAEATANVNYAPGGDQKQRPRSEEDFTVQKQETNFPEFAGMSGRKGKKYQETNNNTREETFREPVASKDDISAAPQYETSGQKLPVLDPNQLDREGERIQQENNSTPGALPISKLEARQLAEDRNNSNINHNARVEADQIQKQNYQVGWGNAAVAKLENVMEDPTDEMRAIMMRKGEEISQDPRYNKDRSSIERQIAKEATDFKNRISRVEQGLPAPRLFQKGKESLLDSTREWEARKKDLQVKLEPLLKEGLYDTSRNLLSKLGYHPEEREDVISSLGEGSKRVLATFPQMKGNDKKFGKFSLKNKSITGDDSAVKEYTPQQREQITQGIRTAINEEPSVNFILLRRELEKKGVDWRIFKDTINDMLLNGEHGLTREQENQLNNLEEPPLDRLDKITHGLNLIGT